MHNIYVTGNIDEAKIREEAYKRAKGDKYNEPAPTTIHYHPYGFGCNTQMLVGDHEPCVIIESIKEEE